ncbi:MAG: hypothetical protein RSB99_04585 [Bacilli bacterium]
MTEEFVLGIDTSNYTTSVAIINNQGQVISDKRIILDVPKGERGIRQSNAVFSHLKNLPQLFEEIFKTINGKNIIGVSVSNRPRPIEGSYMPCFVPGLTLGKSIASLLDVPLYEFSHQEGHIEAIKHFSNLKNPNEFICFHLSGGTTEILKIKDNNISIIGHTLDLSFGQLIDRIGVSLGLKFPAGKEMDNLALLNSVEIIKCKDINIKDLQINISGIESHFQRLIKENQSNLKEEFKQMISNSLFTKILLCLQELVDQCKSNYQDLDIVFAGGVSESKYIRKNINGVIFGDFGADNAVGTALLGGNKVWPLNL